MSSDPPDNPRNNLTSVDSRTDLVDLGQSDFEDREVEANAYSHENDKWIHRTAVFALSAVAVGGLAGAVWLSYQDRSIPEFIGVIVGAAVTIMGTFLLFLRKK